MYGIQTASPENRVALVIGQSAYRSVPALPNPANDAKMMTDLLTSAGFEVTAVPDAPQTDMRRAIADFIDKLNNKGPDTVALLYYAGHGLQVDIVLISLSPRNPLWGPSLNGSAPNLHGFGRIGSPAFDLGPGRD